MAEYKVGQRIIDFEGDKGEIVEIKSNSEAPYLLRVEDEPLQYWSNEHGFTLDDTPSGLQVSKERIAELEAALWKTYADINYYFALEDISLTEARDVLVEIEGYCQQALGIEE